MMNTKYAAVTGVSGGIGQAICRVFKKAGAVVIGLDVRGRGGDCDHFVRCDLSAPDLAPAVRAVRGLTGSAGLYVLVNNAAVQMIGPVRRITKAAWQKTLDVNLTAPFLLSQALLPDLEKGRGSIVNVTSVHASLTKPGFTAYATSKAGLTGLTRSMAVDLAPRVRVNAVAPAAVATPMLEAGFVGRPKARKGLDAVHPIGRIATPDEVAEAVLFLASSKAAFMTGQVLGIDGGIGSRLHDPA